MIGFGLFLSFSFNSLSCKKKSSDEDGGAALDSTAPTVTVAVASSISPETTVGSDFYISGTVNDDSGSVKSVVVTIQQGSGSCLSNDKSAFNATCPNSFNADVKGNTWLLSLKDEAFTHNLTYYITATATDNAGNTANGTGNFTWAINVNITAGSATQTLGFNADVTPVSYRCAEAVCSFSITSDTCGLATLSDVNGDLTFDKSPGLPLACTIVVTATGAHSETITTKTITITSAGSVATLYANPMGSIGATWGKYQKSATDATECDPDGADDIDFTDDDDANCVAAYKIFTYRLGPSSGSSCASLSITAGTDTNFLWNCSSGTIKFTMRGDRSLEDFIDYNTGSSFLTQAVSISTSLGTISFNLVSASGATKPWSNSFCQLSNGKGHIMYKAGAYTYYPRSVSTGDNDAYPNDPLNLDACDNNTNEYLIKVVTASQSPFYGYEIKAKGQSIVGCVNTGSACGAPTLTYVADATVNPRNVSVSTDAALVNGSMWSNTTPGWDGATIENLTINAVSTTSRFEVGLSHYRANNAIYGNLTIDQKANNDGSDLATFSFARNVFLHDAALLQASDSGIYVFDVDMGMNTVTVNYPRGFGIQAFGDGDFRMSNIKVNSVKVTGSDAIYVGTNGKIVGTNIAASDVPGTGGYLFDLDSSTATSAKIYGLNVVGGSDIGVNINAASGNTILKAVTAVNSLNGMEAGKATVTGALIVSNESFGLLGSASGGSITDVILNGNYRNSAVACSGSVDGSTGQEYCIQTGFTVGTVNYNAPTLRYTTSASGPYAPPSLTNMNNLTRFQGFSRFATDLAATLASSCLAGTCYMWDNSLAAATASGLAYYTTCSAANAYEVLFDGVGNNDGVCDTNENCIYMQNIGAYQGHGAQTTGCANGTGSIYSYATNGY